ncbi:phage baseplate assembly protein V [Accumulibacter sp.]|uniref:phage baseplate assembly protein V n=1 Tax=Accumulibacter sp. TaxID=2053492 RepID=UPI0025EE93BC|nr:phage baseplate assembly protein V [Accumulibacter sp.]MCM8595127.1 phage baseplate assembly protein V [Accumulibacter sp.]MCM8625513.1 phage baseplate assembly protein V [Accumulibacter sp.]MDS4049273.1 phage baseplate assembly protein V [Accumulibacter sp.]
MIDLVDRRIRRALGGIRQAFRSVLSTVNPAGGVQLAQAEGLAGEALQDAELFQHYGFTSRPPAGTMAVVLPIGGRTSHGIIVATEHASYRLRALAGGEVALYDDQGQQVLLHRNGVTVKTAKKLRLEAQDIEMHATHSWSWDVAGFGERWTANGGSSWEHKTWQTGASVSSVTLPIHPPEGP